MMTRIGFLLVSWLLLSSVAYAGGGLSQAEYNALNRIYEHMENDQWQAAQQSVRQSLKATRSDYARAVFLQTAGQINLELGDYQQALKRFSAAYDLAIMPKTNQGQLLRATAQLSCATERWIACIERYGKWQNDYPSQIKTDDYVQLAQAHVNLQRWQGALETIQAAIGQSKATQPPKSWLNILVTANSELKRWQKAAQAQATVVQHYPDDASRWRLFTRLNMLAGDYSAALASQRLGYVKGYLVEARDLELLAQLFYRQHSPYFAAVYQEKFIANGGGQIGEKHRLLLAQYWLKAKEWGKAELALERLATQFPSSKNLKRLSALYLQNKKWRKAEALLMRLVEREASPKNYLYLGMAQAQLKQFKAAKSSLQMARANKQTRQQAIQWEAYVNQMLGTKG